MTCGRIRVRSATWSTESPRRVRAAANSGPMTGLHGRLDGEVVDDHGLEGVTRGWRRGADPVLQVDAAGPPQLELLGQRATRDVLVEVRLERVGPATRSLRDLAAATRHQVSHRARASSSRRAAPARPRSSPARPRRDATAAGPPPRRCRGRAPGPGGSSAARQACSARCPPRPPRRATWRDIDGTSTGTSGDVGALVGLRILGPPAGDVGTALGQGPQRRPRCRRYRPRASPGTAGR